MILTPTTTYPSWPTEMINEAAIKYKMTMIKQ